MVAGIKGLGRRPFDGDTRTGPRHSYIFNELKRSGCHPTIDQYGNIWVEKGEGKPLVLFSSHLDVDPQVTRIGVSSHKAGNSTILNGVLDNAVGCYINIMLAKSGPKHGRAIYIFTASEEVQRDNHRNFARSAKEIVRELRCREIKPDFCVAIDVTYPKLLHPQEKMNWARDYEELFDIHDRTHCYLDGFSRPVAKRLGISLVRRFHHPKVAARRFHGHDEAFVYDKLSPSFAFGPVVYGHFDKPDQTMPLSHLRTAMKFLKSIQGSDNRRKARTG